MMTVDNVIRMESIAQNNAIVTSNSKLFLTNQWKEWADNTQFGKGEQRGTALLRLTDCLEHHTDLLVNILYAKYLYFT